MNRVVYEKQVECVERLIVFCLKTAVQLGMGEKQRKIHIKT